MGPWKRFSRRKRMLILSATVCATALFAAGAWYYQSHFTLSARISETHRLLAETRTGLGFAYIDAWYGHVPTSENLLHRMLTTPIAYILAMPVDPFSPQGETFHFVSVHKGMEYILSSNGPDGDWDLGRLPDRVVIPTPYQPYQDTTAMPFWQVSFESTDWQKGQVVADGEEAILTIPRSISNYSDVIEYLAGHGIAPYDPTNGAQSDGDIFVMHFIECPG